MEDAAEVRYRQTGSDAARAATATLRQPEYERQLRAAASRYRWLTGLQIVGMGGLGLAFVEGLGLFSDDWRMPEPKLLGLGIGLIVGFWMYASRFRFSVWRRTAAAQMTEQCRATFAPALDADVVIRVTPAALEYHDPRTVTRWAWPAVREVVDHGWCDQIITYGMRQMVVPRAAFADDGARAHFLALLARYGEQAGGDTMIVEEYLRGHDLACPKCKYALRGTRGAACPECGTPVTLAEITAACARTIPLWDPWAKKSATKPG